MVETQSEGSRNVNKRIRKNLFIKFKTFLITFCNLCTEDRSVYDVTRVVSYLNIHVFDIFFNY